MPEILTAEFPATSTSQPTADLRWFAPHGVQGPRILQQRWATINYDGTGTAIEQMNDWREIPTAFA